MAGSITRRHFLIGTAGALGAAGLTSAAAARKVRPGERVRLGVIGVGGRGEGNWSNLTEEEVVMLCDVDTSRVDKAAKLFPNAEIVQDFRRVIDRKDIDAVVISTPDHMHAIPSVWAMQTGKHVYCEKPLAHSVYEVRVMRDMARKNKLVTQMGTQIHAGTNYRRCVELIQSGAIGAVRKVDVWCNRRPDPGKLRTIPASVPTTLDYDLWVGPAPYRPYDPAVVPFNWRWWWEFGGGVLADMACHFMDLPHWALNLRYPERVKAEGTLYPDADNKLPVEMRVDFHYPAREGQPPVHLTWFHGNGGPKDENGRVLNIEGFANGVLFHGERGQLLADYDRRKLLPEAQFRGFQAPSPTIPDSIGHQQEWADAIRTGAPTTCNWDYSGALAETVLLGNVAFRLGREIEWNAEDLEIKNVHEKEWQPLLRREYRGDWKLKR
jgi:predicted dehydrogenase